MKHAGSILQRLGISDYKEDKDEYICCCLFCEDSKYNLQINFVKGLYHCWACNSGGSIYKFIELITGLDREEATERFYLNEVDVDAVVEEVLSLLDPKKKKIYNYKKFKVMIRYRHWMARNVDSKTVSLFDLGFDKVTNRLVIPLMHNYKCVGLVRRSISKSQQPKYLVTKNFDTSKFLFGYDNINRDENNIVLTEGPIDAIIARQFGLNSVGLMGTSLNNFNRKRIINDFENIMLMLDNDGPGQFAQDKLAKQLVEDGANVFIMEYNTDDPGELSSINDVTGYRVVNLLDL